MKDLKISKELISEVLNIKPEDIVSFKIFMNELFYYRELLLRADCQGNISKHRDSIKQSINIYEFAFKCKEWIINKEYHINTSENRINNYIYLYKMIKSDFGYEIDKSNGVQFDSKGYINNLFEACEWILKELNEKI